MDVQEAAGLIEVAVPRGSTTWSDLGAGSGTFTRALAMLLGRGGRVYAVERDLPKLKALRAAVVDSPDVATILPIHADFLTSLDLPPLDGTLLANALHYVPSADQPDVLDRIVAGLAPNGRLVVVDYDGRTPNQWVPFPVSIATLREIGSRLDLTPFTVVGSRPSAYGGTMYAAYAIKRGPT